MKYIRRQESHDGHWKAGWRVVINRRDGKVDKMFTDEYWGDSARAKAEAVAFANAKMKEIPNRTAIKSAAVQAGRALVFVLLAITGCSHPIAPVETVGAFRVALSAVSCPGYAAINVYLDSALVATTPLNPGVDSPEYLASAGPHTVSLLVKPFASSFAAIRAPDSFTPTKIMVIAGQTVVASFACSGS